MAEQAEIRYRDPRVLVRRLRDNLSAELAGLNEDEPWLALGYAAQRLADELQVVRLYLELAEVDDDGDPSDDAA